VDGRDALRLLPAVFLLPPVIVAPSGALAVALCATAVVLVGTWRWPVRRIGLGAAVVGAAVLSLVVDVLYTGTPSMALLWMPFELAGLLVVLGRAVRSVRSRRVVPVTALVVAAVLALPLRFSLHLTPPRWDTAVLGLVAVPFPIAVAIGIGVYLRGLDTRRVEAVADARVRQRLELAALLHDSVAHEVTGIVVEAQAARFVPHDEVEAREAFTRVEEAALRALDSMDRAVTALRADDLPALGLADLPALVERSGVRGELADVVLGRDADEAAYAVVLEALTNVRRHAPRAGEVVVAVVGGPFVEVSVVDNGPSTGGTRASGGSGLAALRDRVEAAGGRLEAGPRGEGWRVAAVFPVR